MSEKDTWAIYLVDFAFRDDPTKSVPRPALFIDGIPLAIGETADAIQITKNSKRVDNPDYVEYAIKDWKEAGLHRPSVVRLSSTVQVMNYDDCRLRHKIGNLSFTDIMGIVEKINKYKHTGKLFSKK